MRTYSAILLFFFSWILVFGQSIEEKLILKDDVDSVYLKSSDVYFDKNGNYCFVLKRNGEYYYETKEDTIGGFKFIGATYGLGGKIKYNSIKNKGEKIYYKNQKGTSIFTLKDGKIKSYQTSDTSDNIAIASELPNSFEYYINGKFVGKTPIGEVDNFYGGDSDWVAFSENGNAIYFIKNDGHYRLFVNGEKIDSSEFRYTQLAINDNKDYVYARGNKKFITEKKYDYSFYISHNKTVFPPARTVWNYELKNNGFYFYNGDDSGPDYILINGMLYKDLFNIDNITSIDKDNFLFTYENSKTKGINVNGKVYPHDFDEIYLPSMDDKGNFAFYGMKDYYLYKFINGEKAGEPLSKYDVRATPLYISPTGESLHYYKTDGRIFLYKDDKQIFDSGSKRKEFVVISGEVVLGQYENNRNSNNGQNLFYMEYGGQNFLVYNGKLSLPIEPYKPYIYTGEKDIGTFEAGGINDDGYFVIQKTADKQHRIIINNQIYLRLEGVDKIDVDNHYLDDKELIFFGIKDRSFYRFKIAL